MSSRTSQACSSLEDVDAVGGGLGAGLGALLQAFLTLDAQPDQGPDLAAQLDRLVFGQVAEVGHLDLTLGVLVDSQSVDHPDGVAVTQPLQLVDDLAMKVRVVEPEYQQLHRPDGHGDLLPGGARLAWSVPAMEAPRRQSSQGTRRTGLIRRG
jgi:hypothetical protein